MQAEIQEAIELREPEGLTLDHLTKVQQQNPARCFSALARPTNATAAFFLDDQKRASTFLSLPLSVNPVTQHRCGTQSTKW
jgi:hypothetical protein